MLPSVKKPVYRAVWAPMVLVALLGAVVYEYSLVWMKSLIVGGMCWFFPQCYAAYRLFHQIQPQAKKFIFFFFRTEVEKLILVMILFIGVIKLSSLSIIGMLIGYMIAQFFSWIILAIGLK